MNEHISDQNHEEIMKALGQAMTAPSYDDPANKAAMDAIMLPIERMPDNRLWIQSYGEDYIEKLIDQYRRTGKVLGEMKPKFTELHARDVGGRFGWLTSIFQSEAKKREKAAAKEKLLIDMKAAMQGAIGTYRSLCAEYLPLLQVSALYAGSTNELLRRYEGPYRDRGCGEEENSNFLRRAITIKFHHVEASLMAARIMSEITRLEIYLNHPRFKKVAQPENPAPRPCF